LLRNNNRRRQEFLISGEGKLVSPSVDEIEQQIGGHEISIEELRDKFLRLSKESRNDKNTGESLTIGEFKKIINGIRDGRYSGMSLMNGDLKINKLILSKFLWMSTLPTRL